MIGLACTSILSVSTGVQSVKAESQPPLQHSQRLNDAMQPFKTIGEGTGWFYDLLANNLFDGYISTNTTTINLKSRFNSKNYAIRDSDNNSLKHFTSSNNGAPYDIDVTGLFKAGQNYYVTTSDDVGVIFSFHVVEGAELNVPTINKVTNLDTKITGTGVPGATIHLTIAGNDYNGTVNTSGNYNISLNKVYPVNSQITLYQEKDNIKSDSITATVVEADHLDGPKINTVTDQDTTVTGTATPGANVHVTVNGLNFSHIASPTGDFSINIEKKYPANTPISVYQELNGVKSDTVEVYVQLTADFIVNKIKSDANNITGSTHPNAQISIRIHDEDFSGTADGNGNFNINLQGATFAVGTEVTITSVSSEGTFTKTLQIYPRDPIIGLVFAGDDEIRGTVDPGASVTINVGGEKYQTTAGATGNFRQSVNPNLVVQGATVTVSTSINGLESDPVTTTVNLNR